MVVGVARAAFGAALICLCAYGISAAQEPSESSGPRADPVVAGSAPIARRSIGVSLGASDASWHYRESGQADTDAAISLDLPLHETVALKIELGTVTWTVNGQSGRELRSDHFTARRLTLSYVGGTRPHRRLTISWRAGGGHYHFSSGTSDLNRHHRFGAHGGAGIEVPVGGIFGVGSHLLYHLIPGPPLRLSRTSTAIHGLGVVTASVDLRMRF
jgi:hypothetical protein